MYKFPKTETGHLLAMHVSAMHGALVCHGHTAFIKTAETCVQHIIALEEQATLKQQLLGCNKCYNCVHDNRESAQYPCKECSNMQNGPVNYFMEKVTCSE